MKNIFISCISNGHDIAEKYRTAFTARGMACRMTPKNDFDVQYTEDKIGAIIDRCHAFVLIISDASQGAAMIKKEVELALMLCKPLFLVNINSCSLTDIFAKYRQNAYDLSKYSPFDAAELVYITSDEAVSEGKTAITDVSRERDFTVLSDNSVYKGIYKGELCGGVIPDGLGEFVGSNDAGDTVEYSGGFKRGKYHGKGVEIVTRASGDVCRFECEYADGIRCGEGKYEVNRKNGTAATYMGQFSGGLPNGVGRETFIAPDGIVITYEGGFQNALYCGEGTAVVEYLNGDVKTYEGNFVSGEYDGMVKEMFRVAECESSDFYELAPNVFIPDKAREICAARIGEDVFGGQSDIQYVRLPDGVEEIAPNAFSGCTGLKRIFIPDSVKIIGENAFLDCSCLEKIFISKNVTKIGQHAFRNCKRLQRVYIPDDIAEVHKNSFEGCRDISICYKMHFYSYSERNLLPWGDELT